MQFDHYHHIDEHTVKLLKSILKEQKRIMATLSDISNAVAAQKDVEQSVVTLLQNLSQKIQDAQASNDPSAMDKVVADIQANTKLMADSVAANTPADQNGQAAQAVQQAQSQTA